MRSCGACVHRLNPILSFAGAPVAEKPTGLWCLQRVSTCQVTMTQAQHYLLAVSTSCLVAGCLNFVFLCAQNQFLWSALLVLLWTRKSVCVHACVYVSTWDVESDSCFLTETYFHVQSFTSVWHGWLSEDCWLSEKSCLQSSTSFWHCWWCEEKSSTIFCFTLTLLVEWRLLVKWQKNCLQPSTAVWLCWWMKLKSSTIFCFTLTLLVEWNKSCLQSSTSNRRC